MHAHFSLLWPCSSTYLNCITSPVDHGCDCAFAAAVDTATDPKAPRIAKTAEPEDIQKATGLAYLHSSHCLGSGDIMVSAMGTPEGKGVGNFILFDQDLKVGSCHMSTISLNQVLQYLSGLFTMAMRLSDQLHWVEDNAICISSVNPRRWVLHYLEAHVCMAA